MTEGDAGDRGVLDGGLVAEFDLIDLEVVYQRKAEEQLLIRGAGGLGGIDAEVAGVAQRLAVDDGQRVRQGTGDIHVDGDGLVVGIELGELDCAAGDLEASESAAGRQEFEMRAIEAAGAIHPSHRRSGGK